jgi:Ca2+-binding EF-hand superfamily protein
MAAPMLNARQEEDAMNWKSMMMAAGVGAAMTIGGAAIATAASTSTVLKAIDPDHDGTVDLNEARAAATALFDRLDKDHDGTLDRKELRGRVSAKDFAAADPDHDGTLTKDEYLSLVQQRFKAADPDNDGTLDAKELKSVARLLK